MSNSAVLLFPHQLFAENAILKQEAQFYLIEEYLFFSQYKFHKQKIAYHRATMQSYKTHLKTKGIEINYIDAQSEFSDIRKLMPHLINEGLDDIYIIDPSDYYLEKRIRDHSGSSTITILESGLFINSREDLKHFFKEGKNSFFQTSFYKQERKRLNILIDNEGEPEGGHWTYDKENRKKYPRKKIPPSIQYPDQTFYWEEAVAYTEKHFASNPGSLSEAPFYPIDFASADKWLDQFLVYRFHEFGAYEDAIVKEELILNHSVLTPMLNIGLIDVNTIVEKSLAFAEKENVPINSTEGFIRQLIGWREFMRGMYISKGTFARTKNFWNFKRKLPASFYDGTTGIEPIDDTIQKVLQTGYCHHIERLMILGNFMCLCEIDPDDVYKWFMELFIDAYDWVMVPNVYSMSQFADGGLMATKPYISGSNYVLKMSNYKKGDWSTIWDALFWRFIGTHSDFFKANPRLSMMYHLYNKMASEKKAKHLEVAEQFLAELDK